jgi:hypothetical protein
LDVDPERLLGDLDRGGPSSFEGSISHGISAIGADQSGACQQRDVPFQGGEAQNEECLIKMGFLLRCSFESIIIIEITGKVYSPADVMGEASVRAGYAFEFALQRSFEANQ